MFNALNQPAIARKAPKSDTNNRGELSRLVIEPAENGFCVCASFEPKKVNPKFDRYSQMPEDEEMVFTDIDSALAYARQQMTSAMKAEAKEQ